MCANRSGRNAVRNLPGLGNNYRKIQIRIWRAKKKGD
jgi:hypothetical protein